MGGPYSVIIKTGEHYKIFEYEQSACPYKFMYPCKELPRDIELHLNKFSSWN